jgi:hypothetical protein
VDRSFVINPFVDFYRDRLEGKEEQYQWQQEDSNSSFHNPPIGPKMLFSGYVMLLHRPRFVKGKSIRGLEDGKISNKRVFYDRSIERNISKQGDILKKSSLAH